MAATRRAVVVHDIVNTRVQTRDYPAEFDYNRAFKGQEIDLVEAEFDRLLALGSIVPADDPDVDVDQAIAEADASGPFEQGQAGDDYLMGLPYEDLIAYVTQNPSEAARVWRLERARPRGPRISVIKATGLDEEGNPLPGTHLGETPPAGAAGPGGALQGAQATPDGAPDPNPQG